jgi:SAM-dependent methyltransferase
MEIQIGTWLRSGQFLTAARLHEVRLQGLAIDIIVGSVVVGSVLAIIGGMLTYYGSAGHRGDPAEAALIGSASERYLVAGIASWEIARAKMRMDPVYLQVITSGRLPATGTLLDLGCGQGLMLALIATASEAHARGDWPASWPAPPGDLRLIGIEHRPRVAQRARQVLGDAATIETQDLSRWPVTKCEAVLIVDVLHLLSRETQDRLLAELAQMMPAGGILMIREADAAGGWRFALVRAGNKVNAVVQGFFARRFYFDCVAGWSSRLADAGFEIAEITRHDSGLFANVLIQARRASPDGYGC